ncbi:MAG: YceH family protein [Betaproteobacteria bacterium]|nr:YceH family protein [Betaproteobacteria bacterium]
MPSADDSLPTAQGSVLPELTLNEGRVLGVLIEKQRSVPDTYPLSLNALVAGCNQKTSRDPVLDLSEPEVLAALDGLKAQALIIESSGGRVTRYAHNAERVLQLPSQAIALLTVLLLRGPQTAGELRNNCERLHRFADISAVEAFLEELAARPSGALVVELPRSAGTRETRWAQLLTGAPAPSVFAPAPATSSRHRDMEERLAALEAEVAALKEALARVVEGLEANKP